MLALLLCAAAAAQTAGEDPLVYRLGPKDLVDVQVVEEPRLDLEQRVTDGGSLILPLVGELPVAGLTAAEAAALLAERLEASFLQRATVTMRVTEFRSRPISVIGAVRRPGTLELSGRWNLLNALTDAGGLAEGHGEVVHILRRAANGLHDQLTVFTGIRDCGLRLQIELLLALRLEHTVQNVGSVGQRIVRVATPDRSFGTNQQLSFDGALDGETRFRFHGLDLYQRLRGDQCRR